MADRNNISRVSQVQNRVSGGETGEEELRDTAKRVREKPAFQLNEAGGPLGEEFKE